MFSEKDREEWKARGCGLTCGQEEKKEKSQIQCVEQKCSVLDCLHNTHVCRKISSKNVLEKDS